MSAVVPPLSVSAAFPDLNGLVAASSGDTLDTIENSLRYLIRRKDLRSGPGRRMVITLFEMRKDIKAAREKSRLFRQRILASSHLS
ncbi:MAG: hypothetical protein KGI97_05730 [Alphaproteobacteria bacterium]|nr:hypothetical protein [Alphaproteobacteria bacterium]